MYGAGDRLRVVYCRHTQTDDNVEHRYSGQRDVPLNEVGLAQATALAANIVCQFSPSVILSSDLLRTRMVAEIIQKASGARVEFLPDLRELHVGKMTGLTKQEALAQFPESHHRTSYPLYDFRDIGGECADDVFRRYARVLDACAFYANEPFHAPTTIVLVGHGTALRTVFVDNLHSANKLHQQGSFQVCDWIKADL